MQVTVVPKASVAVAEPSHSTLSKSVITIPSGVPIPKVKVPVTPSKMPSTPGSLSIAPSQIAPTAAPASVPSVSCAKSCGSSPDVFLINYKAGWKGGTCCQGSLYDVDDEDNGDKDGEGEDEETGAAMDVDNDFLELLSLKEVLQR
ncbi:hypothetical protein C0995_011042 [Termitomyces sp. Mi166|nr:hypothetical protein C0995_011042 [Termitomyces sp. Mi166\